jgi:phosphatidate phosphatase APP1
VGGVSLRGWVLGLERAWDARPLRRHRTPEQFRIECYLAHGGPQGVVVRGRVLDDSPLSEAEEGEGALAAVVRSVRGFVTAELPGVPLSVRVGDAEVDVTTDREGYFLVRLRPDPTTLTAPWTRGSVGLAAPYRGLEPGHRTDVEVRVPAGDARFGVISDVDDTILETGVQRVRSMLVRTFTGSALTRSAFPGAAELYRELAEGGANPFFYVSSSPWNLHAFLTAFLAHRGFPRGPVLLRDLFGTRAGREPKEVRLREILELHPHLSFVLVGDSGEEDPRIYADLARAHPGRVLAVYIREVRLDPGDGRVEEVVASWSDSGGDPVPFVLVADSDALRADAEARGLLSGSR